MRRSKLTLALLLLIIIFSILTLSACRKGKEEPEGPVALSAPTVTLTGEVASWAAEPLAVKLEISVDGNLSYIENTVTSRKLADGQSFKVRAIGDGVNYTDSPWSNTVTYNRIDEGYTVTWMNGNETLEIDKNVPHGATPEYNGATPTKAPIGDYHYTFEGWTPALSPVTENVIYTAKFTASADLVTVIFYDDNGVTELARAVIKRGESATYPYPSPVKVPNAQYTFTFEKWVTSRGGDTEALLTDIKENTAVFAKYTATERSYTVSFKDHDGAVLSEEKVTFGKAATAPTAPEREGYRFDGWDKEFSAVTEDMTVNAKYVKQLTVEFYDYDGTLLDVQFVDLGSSANAPDSPERQNYRFDRWDKSVKEVTEDMTVTAVYVRQYKVIFLDYDGSEVDTVLVDEGGAAEAPVSPSLTGYSFIGWDKEFSSVTSDMTVNATYELKTHTVRFLYPDGTVIDSQTVEHGFSAALPEHSEFYVVGTGDTAKVYGFTGWSKSFDEITEDTDVTAVYGSVYTLPVLFIEFSDEKNGDAVLYVYSHGDVTLNAIEFTVEYKTDKGNIHISSASVNSANQLLEGGSNHQSLVNNNEKTFTFAWSDARGKTIDWCSKLFTFSFTTDGATVSKDTFAIVEATAVISDKGGSLEKITPAVSYR